MKKLLFLAILGTGLMAHAQDYKKVQASVMLNQFENAKKEIDKLAADPKAQGKAETWYWKAKVYSALYKDDKTKHQYGNLETVVDTAFKKYMELDKEMKMVKDNGGQDIPFAVYQTTFGYGVNEFNNKKWDSAAYYFKFAVEYSDIIFSHQWASNKAAFDTTAILYTAYALQNSKKMDEAYHYYSRLADAKAKGQGFEDVYKFILITNSNKKDKAAFDKYLAIAKEVYPNEDWDEYETDYVNKNFTLKEKSDLFDKQNAAGTLNAKGYLTFADMFAHIPQEEKDKLDSAQQAVYQDKAITAFKMAYTKDTTVAIAAFNAGVLYYNDFNTWDDRNRANIKALQELNAQKAAIKDPKKKAALTAQLAPQVDALKKINQDNEKPMLDAADSSIEWLEKCYSTLKSKTEKTGSEKNITNKTVDFLANLYLYKRDKVKVKDPKAYDAYDAKYKLYDSLHNQ
ncbi:MAG: hypothetical protein KGO81_05800 [Bacteroidota bacterium]|nr:hypothetical protein [Bacteroidota bacterium]